jgi:multidrug efflux pump subunit AcrA (membrane-fusion protein)
MPKKKPYGNATKVLVIFTLVFVTLTIITIIAKNTKGGSDRPPYLPEQAAARGREGGGKEGGGKEGGGKEKTKGQGDERQGEGRERKQNEVRGGSQGASQGGRNVAVVRVTPVVLGTIENGIVLNGDVIASRQVSIYPQVAGKIVDLRKRVGDFAERNEVLAYIDQSRPGEVFSNSPLRATISGTIIQSPYNIGDTVTSQSVVYIIGDLSSLVIETYVPERFASAIKKGLNAEISFDSIANETFKGSIREVSPIIDPASRTMRIQIKFDREDFRVRSGMFATVRLVINTKRNVPVIPRNAVINTYGKWVVFVVEETNIAVRREIVIGLDNDEQIEVVSGLDIGDRIVTAGQNFLTNNEPVRITE